MSLLWDRLATNGLNPNIKIDVVPPTVAWKDADPQIFDIQNVADYYHTHLFTEDRSWDLKDVPNIAPPFDTFWMEFRHRRHHHQEERHYPPMAWGIAFNAVDLGKLGPPEPHDLRDCFRDIVKGRSVDYWKDGTSIASELFAVDREAAAWDYLMGAGRPISYQTKLLHAVILRGLVPARWYVAITVFSEVATKISPIVVVDFPVTTEGQLYPVARPFVRFAFLTPVDVSGYGGQDEAAHQVLGGTVMPALLAISFLHCKNVATVTQTPPAKLSKAAQKRHGKPLVRYHMLNIEPMKQVLKHEGQSEKTGLKRALHICRGHFAHYTEEKPLFGRVSGRFWIPSHVRGSLDEGIVDKDYRIKEPKV